MFDQCTQTNSPKKLFRENEHLRRLQCPATRQMHCASCTPVPAGGAEQRCRPVSEPPSTDTRDSKVIQISRSITMQVIVMHVVGILTCRL